MNLEGNHYFMQQLIHFMNYFMEMALLNYFEIFQKDLRFQAKNWIVFRSKHSNNYHLIIQEFTAETTIE
jgi:hypothetical protein